MHTIKGILRSTGMVIGTMACIGAFASSEPDLVKNGDFSSSTFTNWALVCKDSVNVTGMITGGQFVITRATAAAAGDTNTWNIQLSHKAIGLEKGRSYTVSFKVKADSSFLMEINAGMNKDPWSTYSQYQQHTVKNTFDSISFDFTMTDSSDAAARLVFDMGKMRTTGTITLDNISMKAHAVTVDPAGEILKNGDFSTTSVANWTINLQKGATATRSVVNGQLVIDATKFAAPDSIPERYFVQLQQTGVKLQKGIEYEIKFHGKCDSTYQIMVYLGQNKDPWANYSGWSFMAMLSPVWDSTSYTSIFTMDSADDVGARLVFDIGDAAGGARKVYLDNISLKAVGGAGVEELNRPSIVTSGIGMMLNGRNMEISGVSLPVTIDIFNATGKKVAASKTVLPSSGTALLSLDQAVASGMYIARITEKSGKTVVRSNTVRFMYQ